MATTTHKMTVKVETDDETPIEEVVGWLHSLMMEYRNAFDLDPESVALEWGVADVEGIDVPPFRRFVDGEGISFVDGDGRTLVACETCQNTWKYTNEPCPYCGAP